MGIFPALQEAGIAALLDPKSEEAVAQLNATYDGRRDAFVQAAAKIGWQAFPSRGSFYAWMPVPEGTPVRVLRIFCLRRPMLLWHQVKALVPRVMLMFVLGFW